KLCASAIHSFRNRERLLPAFDRAWTSDDGKPWPAKSRVGARKRHDGVLLLHVTTYKLVRFGDADDFLHAGHIVERARFDLTFVTGDANRGALRAGDGMWTITERLDFGAHGANLVRGGVRLHDYQRGVS